MMQNKALLGPRPLVWILALVALLSAPAAHAQLASGEDPAAVADRAVQAWLEQEPMDINALSSMSPEAICRELPGLVTTPPPPAGTRVNIDDRRELPSEDENVRVFSYSAVRPGDRLEVVQVRLERGDEGWSAQSVGFRQSARSGVQEWLQEPAAGWFFVGFSALVAYLLATPSFLRRWLGRGLAVVREHRRLVTGTMILLYAIFSLGAFFGSQLPESCTEAVLTVVSSAIASVGATEAYGSGNVARAAVVTFHQNFVVVTLSVTFSLALLFGIPAYLLAMASFFVQAIPFGLVGVFGGPQLLFVLVLLLLELTSYFLVVAGGGMLLVTLLRKGFSALPEAVTKAALMLPIAMVLLLVGAWYEAAVLLLGAP